jgi:hypothetical protein
MTVDSVLDSQTTRFSPEHVGIVVEDDVDIERDIHVRLATLWLALPENWDIVFLGKGSSQVKYRYLVLIPR